MSDDITIGSNPKQVQPDAKLIQRAIRQRWPISEEVRKVVVDRMAGFVADPLLDPDRAIAAARMIGVAEGQNQADDHVREKNERIDGGKATEATEVRVLKVEFDR
jgi:hypothetical protein